MGLFPEAVFAVTLVWTALAFALTATVLHHRRLAARMPDDRAYLLYFLVFFGVFMAVPLVLVFLGSAEPGRFLAAAGFTAGKWRLGLPLAAAGVPIGILVAVTGSGDPAMRAQYPFSKRACASPGKLAVHELAYFFFYYVAWEFLFRGLLFLPLVPALGLVPALAFQTALSTLFHFGHPDTEVFAALGAGFIFGIIAWATGSFFYTVLIHAAVGIGTDVTVYLRHHRRPAGHV
jgi:membrane protease YdiL (CAAX protease family)